MNSDAVEVSEAETKITGFFKGRESRWQRFLREDPYFKVMNDCYSVEFYECYNKGFHAYLEGDWDKAKRELIKGRDALGMDDGPTENLLRFMETAEVSEWKGYREDY